MFEHIQHIALLIMCLLTQSGKDCHLAYSQISFTNHTNRHVTSSDWRFTFLCPDLTSSKLSDSVTAHWVLFVVCQDTDANFKIRQRTRLRTCEWKKMVAQWIIYLQSYILNMVYISEAGNVLFFVSPFFKPSWTPWPATNRPQEIGLRDLATSSHHVDRQKEMSKLPLFIDLYLCLSIYHFTYSSLI